jgi:hypothetical protein
LGQTVVWNGHTNVGLGEFDVDQCANCDGVVGFMSRAFVAEARLFSSPLTRPPKVGGLLLSSSGALALVLMVQKKARQLRRALEVRTCFDAKRSPNIVCPRPNAVYRIPDIRRSPAF